MIGKFLSVEMGFQNDSYGSSLEADQTAPVKYYPFPWLFHPVTLVFIILSMIGNTVIFALVCVSKTFRRPSNYLIGNLCVSSTYFICVFCFFNFRQAGHLWDYNQRVCSLLGVFQRLSVPVLPYTLTAISLDRSRAARNPLDHATNRTILVQVLSIWLLGLLIVLPRAFINQHDPSLPGSYKCRKVPLGGHWAFQTIYACFVLAIVYLIPTYILIKEFITLRSKMRFLTLSQVEHKKRFRHRLRLMQNSCIFTAVFIVCWLPQGIFQFPFDLPSEMREKVSLIQSLAPATNFSRQLVFLNTCLNPILLLLLSFDVREYLATFSFV